MRNVIFGIDPAPTDEEREAILSALDEARDDRSAWGEAALREGVEGDDAETA
jgi:hypothetical protein